MEDAWPSPGAIPQTLRAAARLSDKSGRLLSLQRDHARPRQPEGILKLAELIDYEGYSHVDQPSLDKLAKNEVNEEICRIGWLMLQSAGDEITGADWAEEIYLDERPQREQLQSFSDNHQDFLAQWNEVVGSPGQWKREALDAMSQGEKAALLERATKAMAFLKTGEAMDLLTDEEMELLYRDMMEEQAAAQAEMLAEDIAMGK